MPGGMPRKPAALRQLEGNRGHRPIPKEIKVDGVPKMPDGFNAAEKERWEEILATVPHRILTSVDVQVLERMARAWASYRSLCTQINALNGRFLVQGSAGTPIPNPLYKLRAQEAALMHRCGEALGMSPIARTKIIEPNQDEDDPLAQLLSMAANG